MQGTGRCLIFTHVLLLLCLIVLSLFYYIPLYILMKDFKGNCPIFMRGSYMPEKKGNLKFFIYYFGSKGGCNLNIFLSILQLSSSLILLIPMGYHAFKKIDLSWLFVFLGTCFVIPILILTGTAMLILTAGFKILCLQVTFLSQEHCRKLQYEDFIAEPFHDFNTKRFYDTLSVAEFGGWASVIVLAIMLCCFLRQLALYGQREAFMVSLQRERERFLQRFHLDEGYVPV